MRKDGPAPQADTTNSSREGRRVSSEKETGRVPIMYKVRHSMCTNIRQGSSAIDSTTYDSYGENVK